MRKARASFATGLFGVAGYEIIDNLGFDTPEMGAEAALKSNSDIVVLCSSDDEYTVLVEKALPMLKTKVEHIVVAGYPEAQIESFTSQGVTDFIHVRTNVLDSLTKYNSLLVK